MQKDHDESDIETIEEEAIEDLDLEQTEALSKDKIKTLRDKHKAAEAEKMAILEDLQRTKAEFLNAKKRMEEDTVRAKERAVDDLIMRLLPLCDSFSMAMKDTAAWESVANEWRTGVEAIHKQLQSILDSYNVKAINPEGETFDANRHDAIGSKDSDGESDQILEVIQMGFERNGTIIRPAKVIISN